MKLTLTMLVIGDNVALQCSGGNQVGAFVAQDWCGIGGVNFQLIDIKAFMPMARALRSLDVRVTRSTA